MNWNSAPNGWLLADLDECKQAWPCEVSERLNACSSNACTYYHALENARVSVLLQRARKILHAL